MQELVRSGADVVLVSQGLEHVMKPLAQHLGVKRVVANRLEFRDGVATGRLLEPVIRPREDSRGFGNRVQMGGGRRRRWRGNWISRWRSCGRR